MWFVLHITVLIWVALCFLFFMLIYVAIVGETLFGGLEIYGYLLLKSPMSQFLSFLPVFCIDVHLTLTI